MDNVSKLLMVLCIVFNCITLHNIFTVYQKAKVTQIELEMLKIKQDTCKEDK